VRCSPSSPASTWKPPLHHPTRIHTKRNHRPHHRSDTSVLFSDAIRGLSRLGFQNPNRKHAQPRSWARQDWGMVSSITRAVQVWKIFRDVTPGCDWSFWGLSLGFRIGGGWNVKMCWCWCVGFMSSGSKCMASASVWRYGLFASEDRIVWRRS